MYVSSENRGAVFTVSSVTNAMRGREVLARAGITAFVGRANAAEEGCGYTLATASDGQRAAALLRAAGIRTRPAP